MVIPGQRYGLHHPQSERPFERFGRLVDEAVSLLREQGFTWDMIRNSFVSTVNCYELGELPEERPGEPEDSAGVIQLPPPFCRLDDDRGAA